jgi:hypothetical protein
MTIQHTPIIGEAINGTIYKPEGSSRWYCNFRVTGKKLPRCASAFSEAELNAEMEKIDKMFVAEIKRKDERKEESKKRNTEWIEKQRQAIVPGVLLHGSWGYDQTQCELFQVISVNGLTVVARRVAVKENPDRGSWCSRYITPIKGEFVGDETIFRISGGGCKYNSSCTLTVSEWDREYYNSWGA